MSDKHPDPRTWALASRVARVPNDVASLARAMMPDPAQAVTFHLRNGREYVRIESPHDSSNVVDRPCDDVDRERWASEYESFVAQQR